WTRSLIRLILSRCGRGRIRWITRRAAQKGGKAHADVEGEVGVLIAPGYGQNARAHGQADAGEPISRTMIASGEGVASLVGEYDLQRFHGSTASQSEAKNTPIRIVEEIEEAQERLAPCSRVLS